MAAPAPVISNPFVVTQAAPDYIAIPASLTITPDAQAVTIAGTTDLADGTAVELYLNGVDTGEGSTTLNSAFTFSYSVPANTGETPIVYTFTVQSVPTPPAPAPTPSP